MATSLIIILALVLVASVSVPSVLDSIEQRKQDQLQIALAREALAIRERARRDLERRIGARMDRYDRQAAADRARLRERRA